MNMFSTKKLLLHKEIRKTNPCQKIHERVISHLNIYHYNMALTTPEYEEANRVIAKIAVPAALHFELLNGMADTRFQLACNTANDGLPRGQCNFRLIGPRENQAVLDWAHGLTDQRVFTKWVRESTDSSMHASWLNTMTAAVAILKDLEEQGGAKLPELNKQVGVLTAELQRIMTDKNSMAGVVIRKHTEYPRMARIGIPETTFSSKQTELWSAAARSFEPGDRYSADRLAHLIAYQHMLNSSGTYNLEVSR